MTVTSLSWGEWLAARYAEATGLPARLARSESEAQHLLDTLPMSAGELRGAAMGVLVGARTDRAEVERLLRNHIRVQDGATLARSTPSGGGSSSIMLGHEYTALAGLGAVPVIVIVGGLTVASVAATLAAIFGRASTYEHELELIRSGRATAEDIERIRDGAPTQPGVAGVLAELGNLGKVIVAGGLAFAAWRLWGR